MDQSHNLSTGVIHKLKREDFYHRFDKEMQSLKRHSSSNVFYNDKILKMSKDQAYKNISTSQSTQSTTLATPTARVGLQTFKSEDKFVIPS